MKIRLRMMRNRPPVEDGGSFRKIDPSSEGLGEAMSGCEATFLRSSRFGLLVRHETGSCRACAERTIRGLLKGCVLVDVHEITSAILERGRALSLEEASQIREADNRAICRTCDTYEAIARRAHAREHDYAGRRLVRLDSGWVSRSLEFVEVGPFESPDGRRLDVEYHPRTVEERGLEPSEISYLARLEEEASVAEAKLGALREEKRLARERLREVLDGLSEEKS